MSKARRRLHLPIFALALACSRPGPPSSPEVEPAAPARPAFLWQHEFESAAEAGTFAVLPQSAGIWTSPYDAEPVWIYANTRDGVVKVIGVEGEFVEVLLGWDPGPGMHCHEAPILDLGLRVFVREAELADVVTRAALIDHGDGTGIVVAPGARVSLSGTTATVSTSTSGGAYFYGDHNHFEVTLDAGRLDIGKFYGPAKADELARDRVPFEGGWLSVGPRIRLRLSTGLGLFARSEHESNHVVVGTNCLRIAGFYQPLESNHEGHGGLLCTGTLAPEGTERWQVPVGAELTWPNGERAGTSFREVVFEQSPIRRGSRLCFVPHVGCEWATGLSTCIAADTLIPLPPTARGPVTKVDSP